LARFLSGELSETDAACRVELCAPGGDELAGIPHRRHRSEQPLNGRGVYRFDQVVIETGFKGPPLVLVLAPPGEGNQDGILAPRLLSDAAAAFP